MVCGASYGWRVARTKTRARFLRSLARRACRPLMWRSSSLCLRQARLIESQRGRAGGYHLTRKPSAIGLGEVLLALGEPLFDDPGYCQRHAGALTDGNCVHQGDCTLRALWQTLEQWMRQTLDRITLADLLQNEGQVVNLVRSRLAEAALPSPPLNLVALTPMLKN